MYARRLTKEEIMKNGITEVTTDGHVFKGTEEMIPKILRTGYLVHDLYDTDENGNKLTVTKANSAFGYVYKLRTIGLHRLMWAWHYGEVPEGMIVDHINNQHETLEDYKLSNLQLLTPAENLAKERPNWNIREIKCQLDKPRSFYELKLEGFTMAYEQAKADHDAKAAHSLRTNIAQTRARLRYWDNHIEEYRANPNKYKKHVVGEVEHECHARARKKRELQEEIDTCRKYYQEALAYYGKDDPYVKKLWGDWKLAIVNLYAFKVECKKAKEAKNIS